MEILKSLEDSAVVESYEVLDFKSFEGGWYYKIKAALKDESVLHAREYADEEERNYAYHWQNKDHQLRIRWDNAPHHDAIPTHPHHKHTGDDVQRSDAITFEEVLEYIEKQFRDETG